MRAKLAITDLTRMEGERVCVAGYMREEEEYICVRPQFGHGVLNEEWVWLRGQVVIRPFAVVEMDLQEHRPHPPHAED